MPIFVPEWICPLTEEAFRRIDYTVMAEAFRVHNEAGRFCDERIYRADLAARLRDRFPELFQELKIKVSLGTFWKNYFLDLVIAPGAVYELKAVTSLAQEHQMKLLHYLFLLGVPRGKLINFRTRSLEHMFVNAPITSEQRHQLRFADSRWRPLSRECLRLRQVLTDLLDDWGGLLELNLYREAIIHFLGGFENVVKPVNCFRGEVGLGWQTMDLLNPDIAFRLTAYGEHLAAAETHLRRLLSLTRLKALQWVNMHLFEVRFVTLTKD